MKNDMPTITKHLPTHTYSMKPLLAFHNDLAIKEKYLARVRAHAAADEIINGQYWEDGMGCAVGCTIHGADHSKYEVELGIPTVLARLEDKLFESIFRFDPAFSKAWPERFLSAPRVGADLTTIWPKFAHWLLVDQDHGVIRLTKAEGTKTEIWNVASLYARWIGGDIPTKGEWRLAAAAAYAYAAYAAAYAAAAAADADADAAAYAADASAYASADADADKNQHYKVMAEKLLILMQEA